MLVRLFLKLRLVAVDLLLLIPHFVRTKRVLLMNTKLMLQMAVVLALVVPGNAMAQLPGASQLGQFAMPGSTGVTNAAYYQQAAYPANYLPANYLPASPYPVSQASYCADGSCDPSEAPCVGACGGSCGGGCGLLGGSGGGGLFSGAGFGGLGGAMGGFGKQLGGGWFDVEYLAFFNKERYLPEVVTQSPVGTPLNLAGQLGQPTTQLIYGDTHVGNGPYSGVRVASGRWLDPQQSFGIGSRVFYVEGTDDFDRSSEGDPILARPYFDTDLGGPSSLLVAFPGVSSGEVSVESNNRALGFDIFLRKLLLSGYCNRLDFIGGYHFSRVDDKVEISNNIVNQDINRAPLGTTVMTVDEFKVDNEFHGGFIGVMGASEDGPLSWNVFAKVAFGNMNQEARISGSTTSTVPGPGGGSFTDSLGLLALPSNIGTVDQDEFAIVPEVALTMGYNVSQNFRLTLGYTFIYWSEVALAGDLINNSIDASQLSGSNGTEPGVPELKSQDFWYSGLSFGGSLRY